MLVWINKTEAFMKYTEKEESLIEFIKKLMPDGVAVAFSGGVDSTLILKAAKDILDNEKNFSDEWSEPEYARHTGNGRVWGKDAG